MRIRPIAEVRSKCAPSRKEHGVTRAARRYSVFLTWALIHTPISANGVTLMLVIVGLLGALPFALTTEWYYAVAGWSLLMFSFLLDLSDGEVARFRKTQSWFGELFDLIAHEITDVGLFTAVAVGIYRFYDWNLTILGAALLAVGFQMITLSFREKIAYTACSRDNPRAYTTESVVGWLSKTPFAAMVGLSSTILYVASHLLFSRPGMYLVLLLTALTMHLDYFLYFYAITLPPYHLVKVCLAYLDYRSEAGAPDRVRV